MFLNDNQYFNVYLYWGEKPSGTYMFHACKSIPKNIFTFSFFFVFSSFFFFRKNYLLLSCATSVRLSVRLSSVEIFSFRGNSLSSKPIDLKIGLNVCEGVVHVRKA